MRSNRSKTRFQANATAALVAFGGPVALVLAGPTFEEIPDAGSTTGTAQPVSGPAGGVGRIKGELTGTADSVDFEDVYLICITDPIAFSATVEPTLTNFDTQLWLFRFQGFGVLSNDNNPLTFPTIFSMIKPPATDATGQIVPGPGLYFLAITSKQNKPVSAGGLIFKDTSINGTEISGPDGAGGNLPLTNWTQAPGTTFGSYAINLTSVKFLELPCDVQCPPSAVIDADAFMCGLTPDPNGGCNEAGNPLQNLGVLSPTSYRSACGTTGTFLPNNRDIDWYRFHLDAPAFVNATLVHNVAGGGPAPNIELFIVRGDNCATQVTLFNEVSGLCPFTSGEIPLPAGDHVAIVTVDAFAPASPQCPVEYLLWLTARSGTFGVCGAPSAGACGAPHPSPGCFDLGCCETVCAADPFCCEETWDLSCANGALAVCLDEPYVCAAGGGAPPNDCAVDAITLVIDTSVTFLSSAATTDGPSADAGACTTGKDIWYRVQVPAAGKLTLSLCGSTNFDSTVEVYELGASSLVDPTSVFDGTHLIACDDDGCGVPGGASRLEIATPVANTWFLIRVGGFITAGIPASGLGTIAVSFAHLVFTTGPTHPVLYDATNSGNLAAVNVGFGSGSLSVAQPQRWLAQAFTVAAGPLGGGYRITEIHGYGFSPAGATNETLNYIVWNRTGTAKPLNGDQLAMGAVPFPTPSDLPDGAPLNEDHEISLAAGPTLLPGPYWLTLYAANSAGPAVPASFGWFVAADNGINLLGMGGNPFAWRSNSFPLPGFLVFTLPATTLQQLPGYDPKDVYNTGFALCGIPVPIPCLADLDGDGFVSASDLAILLGAWGGGGSANLDGVGVVDAADLAILLGAWGRCPSGVGGSAAAR
ncbi:MAG: hypothetical protein SGJ09_14665 [Phycisphaerae bacterium]|nr:hypothetical protein [Phycisphaerae bacterium]